jgi:hypothetical protein
MWYKFFKNVDKNKYTIYIHYKETNTKLKYFDQYKLTNCIPTKWGDISLTHAHNLLFKKALEDPLNYKFINVSQACIPFKTFDHIYNFLTKDNNGYFNVAAKENNFPRCDILLNYIDKQYISKSSEWFILNRTMASIVSNVDKNIINKMYSTIMAPEEHYFITTLYVNKIDNIITTPNLANGATTFINWGDMDYRYSSAGEYPQPKAYTNISDEEALYLVKSVCLFGRKFMKECNTTYIRELLQIL